MRVWNWPILLKLALFLFEFDDILNHQMIALQFFKMHVIRTYICSRGIAPLFFFRLWVWHLGMCKEREISSQLLWLPHSNNNNIKKRMQHKGQSMLGFKLSLSCIGKKFHALLVIICLVLVGTNFGLHRIEKHHK